jgi:hypothetical protein
MAEQYAYAYAKIDENGWCYEVFSDTEESTEANVVRLPEYNEDYLMKYYINGAWYEDAAGTIPFNPA